MKIKGIKIKKRIYDELQKLGFDTAKKLKMTRTNIKFTELVERRSNDKRKKIIMELLEKAELQMSDEIKNNKFTEECNCVFIQGLCKGIVQNILEN